MQELPVFAKLCQAHCREHMNALDIMSNISAGRSDPNPEFLCIDAIKIRDLYTQASSGPRQQVQCYQSSVP